MTKTKKCRSINKTKTRKKYDLPLIKKYNSQSNKYIDRNLVKTLVKEFKSIIKINKEYPITKLYKYSYSHNYDNDDDYGALFFIDKNNETHELIDFDYIGKKYDYFHIGNYVISNNEEILAYSLDTLGDRNYSIFIKSFYSNKSFLISTECSPVIVFSPDSDFLYYIKYDPIDYRPAYLYSYDLCSKKNTLIYFEKNRSKSLDIYMTSDNREIVIIANQYGSEDDYSITKVKEEIGYVSKNTLNTLFTGIENTSYSFEHWHYTWYILKKHYDQTSIMITNDFIKFKTIIKYQKNLIIEHFFIKNNILICLYKNNNNFTRFLSFYNINTNKLKNLYLSNENSSISFPYFSNLDPYSNFLYINYETFLEPNKLIKINLSSLEYTILYSSSNKSYNPSLYSQKIIKINNNVYITMLYKKSNSLKNSKCLLYGYGAYGNTIEPEFKAPIISLLNRDFIYCVAHIRGSMYTGYHHWLHGKLMHKKNTFKDFITAADYLFKNNYTSSENLCIWGRSAGGLLIGAVINMYPNISKLAIMGVPFVDVVNTMTDTCQPLTTEEFKEWGNPKDKKILNYLKSYDPISNINLSNNYPNIYIYSNLNDTLVPYFQPLKYYKKIKNAKIFENKDKFALLNINLKHGHGQASKTSEALYGTAEIYSMIIKYT